MRSKKLEESLEVALANPDDFFKYPDHFQLGLRRFPKITKLTMEALSDWLTATATIFQ